MFLATYRGIDDNILELRARLSCRRHSHGGRHPLTGIVGTFFVKDYLGLSAAFIARWGSGPAFLGAQDADRPPGGSRLR